MKSKGDFNELYTQLDLGVLIISLHPSLLLIFLLTQLPLHRGIGMAG